MQEKDIRQVFNANFMDIVNRVATSHLDQRHGQQENPSVTPAIIIGLGGSGVKSVARLKWRLKNYYKAISLAKDSDRERDVELNRFMSRLSFLAVDTVSYDKILQEDPEGGKYIHRELSRDEYIAVGGFVPARYIQQQYDASPSLQSWWNRNYNPPQNTIEDGAKRVRSLGRLALYQARSRIRAEITKSVGSVNAIIAQEAQRGLVAAGDASKRMEVFIFSGTCGGTGSGMVLDIIDMCCVAITRLGAEPSINIILTMPGVYVQQQYSKKNGEELARAYAANAYAFFKELSHMIHDARNFHNHTMDALDHPEDAEFAPFRGWRPNRIYLVDTEIAGQEILPKDMGNMFMMGADYICQQIIASGGALAYMETNVDDALDRIVGGQKAAYSSFGISYIMYPSKTISRCLSAMLLHDAFSHALRSPVGKSEKDLIAAGVRRLSESLKTWLDPAGIDERLSKGTEEFSTSALSDKNEILARHKSDGSKSYTVELGNLAQTGEDMEVKGRKTVEQNYAAFREEVAENVGKQLGHLALELVADGIPHALEVLSQFESQLRSSARSEYAPNPAAAEEEAQAALQRVEKMEQGPLAIFRKGKIEREIEFFVRKVQEETKLSIMSRVEDLRAEHLASLADHVRKIGHRIASMKVVLETVSREMKEQANDASPDFEETSVGATTQYVPEPPTPEGMSILYRQSGVSPDEFFRGLARNTSFMAGMWKAGADDVQEAREGLAALLNVALESAMEKVGQPHLSKTVTEAIRKKWGNDPEGFRDQNGRQLLKQVDPTWALNEQSIPDGQPSLTKLLVGTAMYPDAAFDVRRYLPSELVEKDPTPGDPRMFMALSSRHGAPLFAVRNLVSYRKAYEAFLDRSVREKTAGSPHISVVWSTPDKLADIGRVVSISNDMVALLAMGLFADWLVREKKYPSLVNAMTGDVKTGPITERGNDYMMITYETDPTTGLLRASGGELNLETIRRHEVAHKLPPQSRQVIQFFVDVMEDHIPTAQQVQLLTEYLDALKKRYAGEVPLRDLLALDVSGREDYIMGRITDDVKRSLARHLLAEIRQLEEWRTDIGTH